MKKTIKKEMFRQHDQDIGMLFGLAIGDAMGAPIEFQDARSPENYVREYKEGGFHKVSKGEFTDDTSMALAMADAFIEKRKSYGPNFDGHAIMNNFLDWRYKGKYSPRGKCFDVGMTIAGALRKYSENKANAFTGSTDRMSAGNGGLMRLAPAIITAKTKDEAIMFAKESTRLTHGAKEALMYSEVLAAELWDRKPSELGAKLKHPLDINRSEVLSGGYVKETYQAAWWAFQTSNSFEECVIKAINRGHDTDTTGAVAGMIAGSMYGFSNIPQWMIDGLQWNGEILFTALKLKLGKKGAHSFLADLLYSPDAKEGDLVDIFGKKAICLSPNANYGGGASQLWAIEGMEAQMTRWDDTQSYEKITCVEIKREKNLFIYEDIQKKTRELPISDIARYDINYSCSCQAC